MAVKESKIKSKNNRRYHFIETNFCQFIPMEYALNEAHNNLAQNPHIIMRKCQYFNFTVCHLYIHM